MCGDIERKEGIANCKSDRKLAKLQQQLWSNT